MERARTGVQASVSTGVHPANAAATSAPPQAMGLAICAPSGATYSAKAML